MMHQVFIFFNKIQGTKIATVNIGGTTERALIIPIRSLIQDAKGNTILILDEDKSGYLRRHVSKMDYIDIRNAIKNEHGGSVKRNELYNRLLPIIGRINAIQKKDEQRKIF